MNKYEWFFKTENIEISKTFTDQFYLFNQLYFLLLKYKFFLFFCYLLFFQLFLQCWNFSIVLFHVVQLCTTLYGIVYIFHGTEY